MWNRNVEGSSLAVYTASSGDDEEGWLWRVSWAGCGLGTGQGTILEVCSRSGRRVGIIGRATVS